MKYPFIGFVFSVMINTGLLDALADGVFLSCSGLQMFIHLALISL